MRCGLLIATTVVALAESAMAQDEATQSGNRMAYDYAMKCFVVDGSATGERKDAGDTAKASYYEAKAHQAFDTAVKLGQTLGYSGTKIDADFGLVQARELPKIVADVAYYRQAASVCKAIGLM